MRGIYIPDMEMPKNCKDCTRMGISHCPMKEEPIIIDGCEKPLNCPVKEVSTHGRCIDADLLCKRLIESVHTQDAEWIEKYKSFIFDIVTPIIADCPTVIEAST